jgi:MFS family permease
MTATLLVLGLTDWSLWISTAMMGISFAVVPGVIWPSTTMLVEQRRLGTALGLISVVQNIALTGANLAAGSLLDLYGASKENPDGYLPMMVFFFIISLTALWSVVALWRREQGPDALGLETIRTKA